MDNKNIKENISKRLLKAFDGRTETAIGKRTKFSQPMISNYIAGRIPTSFIFLVKLAEEYKINLHWLLTGENK